MNNLHDPVAIQLAEIKQELKILNKHLASIAKMVRDYMEDQGVYFDPENPDLTRLK